jgi:sortase A
MRADDSTNPGGPSGTRAWLGRVLVGAGAICLLFVAWQTVRARTFFADETAALEAVAAPPRTSTLPTTLEPQTFIGTLTIDRLGFSAAVAEGETESTLGVAIGHLPDTPLPWLPGNSGLAGHRNTFFRPLEHVRLGDKVSLTTPYGEFRYHVRETLIVDPDDVWVLDPTVERMITLVTCYPFEYVGRAPQRFIVKADEVFLRPANLIQPPQASSATAHSP